VRDRAHPAQQQEQQFPTGLSNSSGLVGKYLMDTVGAGIGGQIPALENLPPHNTDGASGCTCTSRGGSTRSNSKASWDFARGYHVEFGGGRGMPGGGTFNFLESHHQGAYGKRYKEAARRYYGSFMWFDGRGEMIPNETAFCEIDPDRWISGAFRCCASTGSGRTTRLKQAVHMQKTFAGIIEAMGGKVNGTVADRWQRAIARGGQIIHEVGTCRMGDQTRRRRCSTSTASRGT
jgi:hypothetical protein